MATCAVTGPMRDAVESKTSAMPRANPREMCTMHDTQMSSASRAAVSRRISFPVRVSLIVALRVSGSRLGRMPRMTLPPR